MNHSERVIKIGYVVQSPNAELCAFENLTYCERPGYVPEMWRVIGDYFSADIEMHQFNGYGVGNPNENSTIFKALVDGIIHVTGPDSSFLTERIANLPRYSSPIGFNHMVAVIKRRPAAIGANYMFGVEKRSTAIAIIFALFFLLYFVKRFLNKKQTFARLSNELINFFTALYWIFFLICMNYIASDLSIELYTAAPKALPFTNLEQMAEALEGGKIQLVAIKASATEKTFRPSLEQAQTIPTAMKFYAAAAKGRILSAPSIERALEMILENDKLVFVVDILNAKGFKDSCKFEMIAHESFPKKPHGFFYSKTAPKWFNLDEVDIEVIARFMEHFMAVYYSPHECYEVRARKRLSIAQLQSLFYLIFLGAGAALIVLGIEHLFALKSDMKSESRGNSSHQFDAWLANFPKQGAYTMQHTVRDGSNWFIHIKMKAE